MGPAGRGGQRRALPASPRGGSFYTPPRRLMETRLGETRLRVTRAAGRWTPTVPAYLSRRHAPPAPPGRDGTGSGVASGAAQPRRPRPDRSPPPGPGGLRASWGSCADRKPGGPRCGAAPPARPWGKATPSPSPHTAARLGPAAGHGPARSAAVTRRGRLPRAGKHRFEPNPGSRTSLPSSPHRGQGGRQGRAGLTAQRHAARGRRGSGWPWRRNRPSSAGRGPGGDVGTARQRKVGAEFLHRRVVLGF